MRAPHVGKLDMMRRMLQRGSVWSLAWSPARPPAWPATRFATAGAAKNRSPNLLRVAHVHGCSGPGANTIPCSVEFGQVDGPLVRSGNDHAQVCCKLPEETIFLLDFSNMGHALASGSSLGMASRTPRLRIGASDPARSRRQATTVPGANVCSARNAGGLIDRRRSGFLEFTGVCRTRGAR